MSAVTAEHLAEWKRLADNATDGPWTTERPGKDALTGFSAGVIVAAVARGQGIYADPPGGSYPENDRRFIAASRNAVPALVAEVERLRGLVYRLSDALTDEGPDWSDEGLARLRDHVAHALPDVEWLQPYRAALPEEPQP